MRDHLTIYLSLDPAQELNRRVPNAGVRAGSLDMVRQRVLQKHLYDRFGGRVELDAFGPYAVDGYIQWMKERERLGDFRIVDPKHRKLLIPTVIKDGPLLTVDTEIIKQAFDPALLDKFINELAGMPANAARDPRRKLIGEVLGQPVHMHQRDMKDEGEWRDVLQTLFVPRLETHYRELHPELVPTEAEIVQLVAATKAHQIRSAKQQRKEMEDALAKHKPGSPVHKRTLDVIKEIDNRLEGIAKHDRPDLANSRLRKHKFQTHLYDTYGGGRALSTAMGSIAIDAQKKWLEQREKLGDFQIADPKMRQKFYDYWKEAEHLRGARLIEDLDESKQIFQPLTQNQE
jgi:hypothetical protein